MSKHAINASMIGLAFIPVGVVLGTVVVWVVRAVADVW